MPWTNINSLNKIYLAIEKEQPDIIVQIGDLYDLFSFSKFARTHDLCTPNHEITEGRAYAESFWKNCKEFAPGASLYQIKGNHDARIFMRAEEKYPEIASILRIDHLWEFPGVTTIDDVRDELEIDGILYIHGYRSKLGDHMRYFLKPVVCGHSHTGGCVFMRLGRNIIWELNVGFIADDGAVPLQYTKTKTTRWTQGYGIIDSQGPRFCPIDL